MNPKRLLLKVGGSALRDGSVLTVVGSAIAELRHAGHEILVVHGGGPAINQELERRGISWQFIDGQRVTTPEMMDVIEMVLCGRVNRQLVRKLALSGFDCVGFAGTDAGLLSCVPASAQLGRVGQVEHVNSSVLAAWLTDNVGGVPIIAPVGLGADGECYNINADWAASQIAVAVKCQSLIFLTDQEGIWDENRRVREQLTAQQVQGLIEREIARDGMKVKCRAILHALHSGVEMVRVMEASSCLQGLRNPAIGTRCVRENEATETETAPATSAGSSWRGSRPFR
ncbi:MAG: acetylglutamate kinase [Bdellovibrio sp.]|nr:MAG: acetylglutamate kinase [Bdellovibrio sp.]